MNLWRLECFVVLAQELHFGRAARRLHVTQPALSSQIKLLEEAVGATLLTRAGTVALTHAGAALLPDAVRVLGLIDEMMERAQSLNGRVVGTLNVLFTRSVLASNSLGIIQQFERHYPLVELSMQSQWTTFNVMALREGRADVAFVRLPLDDATDVEVLPLGQDEQLVALPRHHRLAAQSRLSDADLVGEEMITWRRDDAPGNFDKLYFRWQDDGPKLGDALPDIAHRLAGAEAAGVLTLVHDFALGDLPANTVARPMNPPLYSEWGLAWRSGTTNSLIRRFVAEARPDNRGTPRGGPTPAADDICSGHP